MSSDHPRNKLVVFRVSQEELDSLKSACAEKKGRNLSDFTRSELLSFLRAQPPDYLIQRKLDDIERQLAQMRIDLLERPCSYEAGLERQGRAQQDSRLNFLIRSEQ
jgi:hypothetical protein